MKYIKQPKLITTQYSFVFVSVQDETKDLVFDDLSTSLLRNPDRSYRANGKSQDHTIVLKTTF